MSTASVRTRTTPTLLVALLVLATVALAACNAGSTEPGRISEADSEAVGEGAPFGGDFADVPLHPRSDPIGTRTEEAGTVTRSYEVRGASPDLVLDFYARTLPSRGWEVVEEPHESGTSTVVGKWLRDGKTLRITANAAPSLGGDTTPTESVASQYSLLLSDA